MSNTYGLQVSETVGFAVKVVDETGLTSLSYAKVLDYGKKYFYRVNSNDGVLGNTKWSPIQSFFTAAAPIDTYRIQVATDSAFTEIIIDDATLISPTYTKSLNYNTQYFWHINATNEVGASGYCDTQNFTTNKAPPFVYNSTSSTRAINFEKGLFHYLTIMLSNCSYNGNVFVDDISGLEGLIQTQFDLISNLEFRGVGCSMVRGYTDSLTIGISAGYYSSTANLTESEALALRVAANNAISNISGLVVSEVRVESTLIQRSTF